MESTMTNDTSCRAPFLGWADMVEIERALMLAPKSEHTGTTLFRLREELDRGEKLGVFSDKDRGRPHPAPLRRYGRDVVKKPKGK